MNKPFSVIAPCTVTIETRPGVQFEIWRGPRADIYHIQKTSKGGPVDVKIPLPGVYTVSGSASLTGQKSGIKKPGKITLPKPDRNYDPSKFHIVYNPDLVKGPARLFYEIGRCEVGPKFYELPIQWQKFIIEHEKAHFKYSDEIAADTYALNSFMGMGYNYSQAFHAMDQVLSRTQENIKRINHHFKIRENEN